MAIIKKSINKSICIKAMIFSCNFDKTHSTTNVPRDCLIYFSCKSESKIYHTMMAAKARQFQEIQGR
ncbi:hypothetical protein NXW09_28905, partial [Bacteroides ovatus]|nr:hypothetical protein [Bacteroides ovatus]